MSESNDDDTQRTEAHRELMNGTPMHWDYLWKLGVTTVLVDVGLATFPSVGEAGGLIEIGIALMLVSFIAPFLIELARAIAAFGGSPRSGGDADVQ